MATAESATHLKDLGNVEYKRRNFSLAKNYYKQAIDLDPSNMTYYTNLAAVHFEEKNYQECIDLCLKAIEIGRENRADYKVIAKAFGRIGGSYRKLGEYKLAKTFYEKSLSEHRTPETRALISEVNALLKEQELKAYIDPAKSEEEKLKGNQAFAKGDFAGAIKFYTEAIKRNPADAKIYSNRAACYTKLAAFDLGLKDCEKCVELDPKFIKGWIRKGKILQGMQDPGQAMTAYEKALEIDPNNSEASEGFRATMLAVHSNPEEARKRAMGDPEIQSILRDPAMRLILEQMQNDPKALQEHLKDKEVAGKIQKLIEGGIIGIK